MANAPPLNDDFLDMLHALQKARVEFIVVGAHALAAHGLPRATGDLDLFVRPSRTNAARVMRALRAFGAPVEQHAIKQSDFARPGAVYQIGLPPRRIDILTDISGVSYAEAAKAPLFASLGGHKVAVLNRRVLVKNKRAAGRDKDMVDVRSLESSPKKPSAPSKRKRTPSQARTRKAR